jgi:hypothetical protein
MTATIRALNDELRRNLDKGIVVITPGVAAMGQDVVQTIFRTIATYDAFTSENNPYEENDFGAFELEGKRVFWKVDYYDKALNHHSPDPADPRVTERVITIMLATEY